MHSFFQFAFAKRDSLYDTNIWVPEIMEEQKLFKIFLKIIQVVKNFCKGKSFRNATKTR